MNDWVVDFVLAAESFSIGVREENEVNDRYAGSFQDLLYGKLYRRVPRSWALVMPRRSLI
jgi:hypothetical protein